MVEVGSGWMVVQKAFRILWEGSIAEFTISIIARVNITDTEAPWPSCQSCHSGSDADFDEVQPAKVPVVRFGKLNFVQSSISW